MVKLFNPNFTINIATKRKRTSNTSGTIVSRKCYAVVALINGEYKAIVNYDRDHIRLKEGDELSNEQLIIPFTKKSLSLKDKTHIWAKHKDKYNNYICIIRNSEVANTRPGVDGTYNAVRENLLIAGHIVRKDGKMYFEYEDLIAYNYLSQYHICDIRVDNDKPLFNNR